MGLEKLYEESKKEYAQITMHSIMREYVETLYQACFYIVFGCFIVFAFLMILIGYQKEQEFQVGLFLIAFLIIIIGIVFHFIYKKELNKQFKKRYNLESEKNIDYIYLHYQSILKNKSEITENLQYLIDFSNIKLEIMTRGFFYNPIVILLISFVMAISVNLLTDDVNSNINFIVASIFLASFILYIIFISKTGTNNIKNKDLSFQYFLKKTQFDIDKKDITTHRS